MLLFDSKDIVSENKQNKMKYCQKRALEVMTDELEKRVYIFEKKQKEMDEAATVRETPLPVPLLHPVAPQLQKWEWG